MKTTFVATCFEYLFRRSLFVILLIFFGLLVNSAVGQNSTTAVKGQVIDQHQQPLPYATVKAINKSTVSAITSCDSLGRFTLVLSSLPDSGTYIIADYLKNTSKPKHLSVSGVPLIITIDTLLNVLNEVTITNTESQFSRKGDRYVFVPGSTLAKGNSVIDIMRHAPLINYDDRTDAFSIINKSNTVVYINNVKSQIPAQMLQQMLRSLPASDIKSVEIITNPGSEYSASTQGGIININLKRQLYEGWLGNISLQSQQSNYNTTILNGSISYRKKKLALQIIPFFNRSYNYNTENDQLLYADGTQQQNTINYFRRYFVFGGGVNLDYDFNDNSYFSIKYWRTNVNGNSRNNEQSNYSNLIQPAADSAVSSSYHGNDFYTYNFGNMNYHQNLGRKKDASIDFNLDFNHFFQKREISGSFNEIGNGSDYYNYLPQSFTNFSESIDFSKPLSGNLKFLAGIQYSNTRVSSDLKYYSVESGVNALNDSLSKNYFYRENYGALYVSLNKSFSKKVYATIGLRFENTDYSTQIKNTTTKSDSAYWNLFPSATLSYSPNPNNQFSYSLSRKIVRPDIESLFPGRIYTASNDYTENNPFLQPSVFLGNEFSYLLDRKYSLSLNYAVAHNSFSQFVIPIRENQKNFVKTTYLNYGSVNNLSVVLYGSQTLIKKVWDIYLTPYFNFGHYSGNVESSNISITNRSFNATIDNAFYLSNSLSAYLTFKYFGKQKDIAQEILNARSTLNFTLRKVTKKFTFMLIFSDLYDGSSITQTNRFTNYLLSQDYSEINKYNRSISLQIRYTFGNTQLKGNKGRKTANEDIKRRSN